MKRIYYHVSKLEDLNSGLLSNGERQDMIDQSYALLSDASTFSDRASEMVSDWIYAAAHNLTNVEINRQAWIGQATCLHNHKANMNETIRAWQSLSQELQDSANAIADSIISQYVEKLECQKYLWD